jgi:hypothetical protein
MMAGRDRPSLPQKILDKTLSGDFMIRAFTKARRPLEKIERLFRPRLTHILSDHALSRLCGGLGIGLTCSVLIPVPLSNTVPSLCMVIMATGIMARDGVAAIAAGVLGIGWVVMLFTGAALGGQWLWHLM